MVTAEVLQPSATGRTVEPAAPRITGVGRAVTLGR
jgi:hypothetical protein